MDPKSGRVGVCCLGEWILYIGKKFEEIMLASKLLDKKKCDIILIKKNEKKLVNG
jgi:hypothetical protein